MTDTNDLIDSLVARTTPVRRLRPPLTRSLGWLVMAGVVVVALAIQHGLRPDLSYRMVDRWFVAGLLASGATGILAAIAAFLASLPDRSRLWLLLPVPTAVAWLATISVGCLTHWVPIDPNGVRPLEAASCFATLLLAAVPLSVAMFRMLRHTLPLRPTPVIFTGALAVAALTTTTLSLLHDFDAAMMILVWNFGTATLVLTVDLAIGRKLMRGTP